MLGHLTFIVSLPDDISSCFRRPCSMYTWFRHEICDCWLGRNGRNMAAEFGNWPMEFGKICRRKLWSLVQGHVCRTTVGRYVSHNLEKTEVSNQKIS